MILNVHSQQATHVKRLLFSARNESSLSALPAYIFYQHHRQPFVKAIQNTNGLAPLYFFLLSSSFLLSKHIHCGILRDTLSRLHATYAHNSMRLSPFMCSFTHSLGSLGVGFFFCFCFCFSIVHLITRYQIPPTRLSFIISCNIYLKYCCGCHRFADSLYRCS